MSEPEKLSLQERAEILEEYVTDAIRKGWRIESQGSYQAVIVEGKDVNHLLHLLLSLLTVGLWLFVWALITLTGGERRMMIYVDEKGYASLSRV